MREFLVRHGVDTTQVQLAGFTVTRRVGERVRAGPTADEPLHRSADDAGALESSPTKVLAASQQVSELAAIGVVVSSGNSGEMGGGPTFVFSGLNQLKPAMIADATARAREAAAQFARDSDTELGGIRQANQGVFEILARDQAPGISEESQIAKTVRVVSTIDYYLR